MKKVVQCLMVAMAFCLIDTAGRAQDQNKFFITGGGSSMLDNRSWAEPFATTIPYKSFYKVGFNGTAGIEVPIKKSKIWSFELAYTLGQDRLNVANYNYSYHPRTSYSLWNNRVSADLVLHLPYNYHSGHPYVVGGVEYDRFSPTTEATRVATTQGFAFTPSAGRYLGTDSGGGVNGGAGIDWTLTSKIFLRMDVRDHVVSSPRMGMPFDRAGYSWLAVVSD